MNLASHTKEMYDDQIKAAKAAASSTTPPANVADAAQWIMDKFLEEGALNPMSDPTHKGFYDGFPWT